MINLVYKFSMARSDKCFLAALFTSVHYFIKMFTLVNFAKHNSFFFIHNYFILQVLWLKETIILFHFSLLCSISNRFWIQIECINSFTVWRWICDRNKTEIAKIEWNGMNIFGNYCYLWWHFVDNCRHCTSP
jgi:hypothetical protein